MLDKIKERTQAATEGPWTVFFDEALGYGIINPTWEVKYIPYADAEFIAHARTDIPWLVERLGEVEKAVRTYRLMANTPASRKLAAELDRILSGEEKNSG
ncbi:hypothetical protein LCGC14_2171140 [marine sediment metagenome]|uniref:Uncharacterized protein n=1 Tax=marine sediment metagenome TaxID=412755 RepID=A0A0F9DPV9_9ZZZZ